MTSPTHQYLRPLNYFLGLLLLAVLGCTDNNSTPDGITHPLDKHVPPTTAINHTIDSQPTNRDTTLLSNLTLQAKYKTNSEYLIGDVSDAAITQAGLLVLDPENSNIKLFSLDGSIIDTIGRKGRGPGEFLTPSNVTRSPDGLVFISDNRRRGISVFKEHSDYLRYKHRLPISFIPTDMCVMHDHLYLSGLRRERASPLDSNVVHQYTYDGELVNSVGTQYMARNFMIRNNMSEGPLACIPEDSSLIHAKTRLPYISKYDTDGARHWVSRLDKFNYLIVQTTTMDGRPAARQKAPENKPYHGIDQLHNFSAHSTLLQVKETLDTDNAEKTSYETYLLSSTTGTGYRLPDRLGNIVDVTTQYIVIATNSPAPAVKLYRY